MAQVLLLLIAELLQTVKNSSYKPLVARGSCPPTHLVLLENLLLFENFCPEIQNLKPDPQFG